MCHTEIPSGQHTPDVEHEEVLIPVAGGQQMPALHTSPGANGSPVLIAPDVFGRSPFYEHLCALLARDGFHALLPDLFFRQGPLEEDTKEAAFGRRARLDEAKTLTDLEATIGWLRDRDGGSSVGTIGFCMGGTFVLDLASSVADLVTVAYYAFPVPPSSVVAPPPAPIDMVDGLRGPVLAFWGAEDAAVGIDHIRRYVAVAERSRANFTHRILEEQGHGFLADADLADPHDPRAETWKLAVDHLRRHLTARAPQTTEAR